MNGWDVLHTLRQNDTNKSTPVIVVTMVAEKIAATGVMISDYLAKPVSANDLLAALRAAGVAPKSGKAKVLVIDDDQNAIKLATQMLVEHGYEVLCEPDGSSGLKTAERERPDGIILDLQMPYVNGFEFLLLYRGKEYGRTTPIIIWTIKELSAADIVKLNESAQAVVQKGNATMNDLLAELQHHIKRAQKNQHI
jgi:DNA-binding response OmpR family regulator